YTSIQAQSATAVLDLEEMIYSTYPNAIGAPEATEAFFSNIITHNLSPLSQALNQVSQTSRKLAKSELDLSSAMMAVRHFVGRPKSIDLFGEAGGPAYAPFQLVDMLSRIETQQ
ncbi:hypothetical protein HK100_008893, partial [Physocladia obscura]